jgi:hypothetical protein
VKPQFHVEWVRWLDSNAPVHEWTHLAGLRLDNNLECQTVGMLIDERSDRLSLAGSIALGENDAAEQVGMIMTIPKCAIIQRRRLR